MYTRRKVLQSASVGLLAAALPRLSRADSDGDDVIVIGAGLAGLHASQLLEELGYSVRLLEGTDRIGGRLYTVAESEVPGHPEIGGSGIGEHYRCLGGTSAECPAIQRLGRQPYEHAAGARSDA